MLPDKTIKTALADFFNGIIKLVLNYLRINMEVAETRTMLSYRTVDM